MQLLKWFNIVKAEDGWCGHFLDEDTGESTGESCDVMALQIDVIMWAKARGATNFMGEFDDG